MPVIAAIAYILAGTILAVPYCLLAGWDQTILVPAALTAPVFVIVWAIIARLAGVLNPYGRGRKMFQFNWHNTVSCSSERRGFLYIFWVWTFYMFLPIVVHWSALALKTTGYDEVGAIVDEHRYASIGYVAMTTVIGVMLAYLIFGVRQMILSKCRRQA